jgi:hypothetical protein
MPMYSQMPAPQAGEKPIGQPANNPYGFITNPSVAPKKSGFGGNSAMRLLAIVGGAGLVLVILAVVLVSVFAKGESPQSLTSLAQQQQELIRIATLGEQQASLNTTKNLAYNVDLSVSTSQAQLISYITKSGTKLTEKQLALKQDAKTDTLLTNAKATSTYDTALQKALAGQLQTYISDVQQAYNNAKSTTLKKTLAANYKAGKALLDQANTAIAQTAAP